MVGQSRVDLLGQTAHVSLTDQLPIRAMQAASRVALIGGTSFNAARRASNDVLGSTTDRARIAALVDLLELGSGERMSWMTPGGPTLVFLDGDAVVTEIVLLRPDYVRSELHIDGDAPLANSDGLEAWLQREFTLPLVT